MKRHGESRKDKGDGGGSIAFKVVCEELCVCVTKLCESMCVTKLCVIKMCVREKLHVREMCVKDCV